uniref:hypothetical protein n=1 Tax=Streptomyces carminius TaxID=2665496 RepID=UPI0011B6FEF3|nr:hypothetical protein [Streptomyces carminius]
MVENPSTRDFACLSAQLTYPVARLERAHWAAWHRHITLAMLALAFLTALAADAAPDRPVDPIHPTRDSEPITLTVPEIRHLLAAAFTAPATTAARLLHWSHWRRRHQATARRSHYRRRSTDEPAG